MTTRRGRASAIEARTIAQAKVNLVLRILGRERSGYHSIETLFLRLDVGDAIRVRVGDSNEQGIHCHGPACPPGGLGPAEANLAVRAARAYAAAAGWPRGFAIDIEKHIPVGGGLGGGSADAAAVLRVLDAMAPKPLGHDTLARLGASLGADVPFFVSDCVYALGWGRGERLLRLAPPPRRHVELLVPPFEVSTQWAYEQYAAVHATSSPRPTVHAPGDLSSWAYLSALATNDLEPIVTARHPELGAHVAALRQRGARIAMMSGSGSTVFGIFDRRATVVDSPGASVSHVQTRTANRVVGVERIE